MAVVTSGDQPTRHFDHVEAYLVTGKGVTFNPHG
jgi:hypothetical protein